MSNVLGVMLLLAQAVSHDGTNGFDPSQVVLIAESGQLFVDGNASPDFSCWLHQDAARRASVVKYFVACAFDERTTIRFEGWTWRGALGLARNLSSGAAGFLAKNPGAKASGDRFGLSLGPDEGKWVSSCLMALANTGGSHQYVSIRGNPPAWTSPSAAPSAGERWTMGYPEGVFFADLLNPKARMKCPPTGETGAAARQDPTEIKSELEKSFTQSLNLPPGPAILTTGPQAPASPTMAANAMASGNASSSGSPTSAGFAPAKPAPHPVAWWPPNVALGRGLDFNETTPVAFGNLRYEGARQLGHFNPHRLPAPARQGSDPDYKFDTICTTTLARRDLLEVVDCPTGGGPSSVNALRWSPLFVHLPRFATLADAGADDPSATIQAIGKGIAEGQRVACTQGEECIGPYAWAVANQVPAPFAAKAAPAVLKNLRDGQSIEVVLRHVAENEPTPITIDVKEKFTAIVRYRSPSGVPKALVEVMEGDGTWRKVVEGAWAQAAEFKYLQVYPLRPYVPPKKPGLPGKPTTLRLRISGLGDGSMAPELNAAAFVPGKPWCSDRDDLLMRVCDEDGTPAGVTTVRRIAPPSP